MESTLLATKLFIPPVQPGLVARPRLLEKLRATLNNRLVLVSAPAGFGKTTLLSQWIQSTNISTAWLSLEEADNDPVRFWEYFIAALQKIVPDAGDTALPVLRSSQPPLVEPTLTLLINNIAAVTNDLVIVLDDYHVINSELVNDGMGYLLDHLPPKMHLIITTRVDPHLPLSRFRGRGMLLEVRADELRFTVEEAASLLTGLGVPALSAGHIEALNTRAEGWVAGLKIAVLSTQGLKDIEAFLTGFTGSQRYVMDYLIDEVLLKQSREVKEFLLKTSILERLNGSLCDAVTQRTDGREILVNLEKANLFLVPLDESREWFRYHHLFADILQLQLQIEFGKEIKDDLHRKASQWYEDNELWDDAINHALAARDWVKAMELIRKPAVIARELRSFTFLNWLRQIPEEQLRTNTSIYMNYIWALMTAGRDGEAEDRLKYLDTVAEDDIRLLGAIAIARASIALNKWNFNQAEDYARKALALLPPDEGIQAGTGDTGNRPIVYLILAVILMARMQYLEAEDILKQSLEILQRMGATSTTIDPLFMLGLIAFNKGELNNAAKYLREASKVVKGHPKAAEALLYLGNVHYERNDLDMAASYFENAAELFAFKKGSAIFGYDNTCFGLALTKMAMSDVAEATAAMDNADRWLAESIAATPQNHALNSAYHAAIALADGDMLSAAKWVDSLIKSGAPTQSNIPIPMIRFIYAQRGKDVEEKAFKEAYELFKSQGLRYMMIAARIPQALDSLGTDKPLDYLAEALTMARPEGYIRVFVDFGMELSPLLREAIKKGIEPEYAGKLLEIIEREGQRRRVTKAKGVSIPQSSEFLSLRELEVLRLAAEGLSNRQIGDKLIISLGTVKTHIYNITKKLGADNRTGAIARARELKLL